MEKPLSLKGKLKISAILRLETGLHIGTAGDFAPIGSVDLPFVRDPLTKQPIIPGSSLKGVLRSLLVRNKSQGTLNNSTAEDSEEIQRLFGKPVKPKVTARRSRLQFFDLKMTGESFQRISELDLDTYCGEIKFENQINRTTGVPNIRQIERVPAGTEFDFKLVYNIEDPAQVNVDMKFLADGLELLQLDYLGGSGSRGYGRVSFHDFKLATFPKDISIDKGKILELLNGSSELQ